MDVATKLNPFLYLERNARENPSGVFMDAAGQKILNSEALTSVKKIAYELRHLGVKPGDMVALDLPDSLSVLFLEAVFHEAAASTVVPKAFDPSDAFTIDWTFTNTAEPPLSGGHVVNVDAQFLERVEQNPYGIRPHMYESEQSLLWVLFSSGTTGRPNAVAVPLGKLDDYAITAIETWMQGDPFLVFLNAKTPMGLYTLYISVRMNQPYLAVGSNDASANVDLAIRYSVTSLKASPVQIAMFVDELEKRHRTLPSVQTVYTVGGAMAPAVSARMRAAAEGCECYGLYGSTEAAIAFVRYYESEDPFDAGHLFPGSVVQIVDDDDRVLPDGQTGLVRHQSPLMVHEYLGNPEGTRASFREGWFYPGDLGFIRPDGGLTLAGRSSEVINAGGVKIDPNRLDHFALTLPLVTDACSFAYTADNGLQQIGIALVAGDGLDVDALVRAFDQEFGTAAPKLVARVDEIPRNTMGKPLRRTLAEKYKEG